MISRSAVVRVVGGGGGWWGRWVGVAGVGVGVGRGVKGILLASWQTVLNPEEFGGCGEFGLKTVIRGRKGLEPEAGQMVKVGRDILQWDAKAVFVTTVIAHGAKSNPNLSMQCRVAVIQCGAAANVQTYTYGRCYDITRPCVNNGIKAFRRTNLFRHCYVHIFLLYFRHNLNGNTNFKINFVLGKCYTRHLAIGATTKLFTISYWNRTYFLLLVVSFFINDLKAT